MDIQLDQHFTHYAQYRILVCNICRYAVWPQGVRKHLDSHHSCVLVDVRLRAALHQAAEQVQPLARTESDLIFPTTIIAPIPRLHLYASCFRCQHESCLYVCETLRHMMKHAKDTHHWISCQTQGGNTKQKQKEPENKIWVSGVAGQRFFTSHSIHGPRKAFLFFEVTKPTSNTELVLGDKAEILAAIDTLRQKTAQDKAQEAINSTFARYSTDNWLKFAGWKIQHRGLTPTELRSMIRLPDQIRKAHIAESGSRKQAVDLQPTMTTTDDESQLDLDEEEFIADCCRAVQRLIQTAQQSCRESNVGRPALQYITHRVANEDGAIEKTMYSDLTVAAMTQYIMRYMLMTTFVLRTYKLPVGSRPPYVLSKAQRESIDDMLVFWQTARPTAAFSTSNRSAFINGIIERCKVFWMVLIDRSTKDRPNDSAMYCAVGMLGVSQNYNDETRDFYLGAAAYSPVIGSVVTVVKMLVIHTAYLAHVADIEYLRSRNPGLDEQEVIEVAISVKDGVKRMTDSFLVWQGEGGDTSHNMHSIQALKAYARKISSEAKAKGHTHWVKFPDSQGQGGILSVNTKDINLSSLGPMLRACHNRLRGQLERELLLTNTPPYLDIGVLVDNPSLVNEPGWSFLKDKRNYKALTINGMEGKDWLLAKILTDPVLQSRLGLPLTEGKIDWNADGVEAYLKHVKSFKEQLLVLVHLTAGAPARGTEILSVEHCNSPENPDGRNIFVENGLVAFAPSWSKTSGHTGKNNAIHRYVPREVSELVVYFLWLVLPFVEAIQLSYLKQSKLSTYLWEASYGHVAVDAADYSIVRPGKADDEDNDDDDDDDEVSSLPTKSSIWVDRSSSSSSLAAKRPHPLNPDGLYSSDRLRRLMHAEFATHGFPQLGIQDWRHAYPAIQRQICRNSVARNTLDVLYFDGQPLANFQARASGHTERTEANTYGRDITEGARFTPDDRVRYRAVSVDWHMYLQFPSVFSPRNPDLDNKGLATEHRLIKARNKARWSSMAGADMRQELRIFTSNPKAEFRPGQKEALQAIFKQTPRVLAIMATGSGKSTLFTLPAMHPHAGTTIVVVPTTALRLDLKRRALPTGIACATYEGANDELPEGAKLVFVTPESATSSRFMEGYLEPLRALGQLDRIVIDECHVVLESVENPDWRPQILELSELQEKGIQLVYLTGTLTPRDMPAFLNAIGLREKDLTILRQQTSRPNIGYSVHGVLVEDGENAEHAHARHIAAEMAKHPQTDQAIVYCQQIEQGKTIASQLNTAMYHGKLPLRTKARLLSSFTKGEMQVMIATNAMGQGVDLAAVKIVFHVGPPTLLRNFVQESGRAGRDGRSASKSIILMMERRTQQGEIRRAKPLQRTEPSMVDFVQSKDSCKRQILDEIIDGISRIGGCKKGEIECENCARSRRSTTTTTTATRTGTRTEAATTSTTTISAMTTPTTLTPARIATADQRQTDEYETPYVEQSGWTSLPTPNTIGQARTAIIALAAQVAGSSYVDTIPSPPIIDKRAQKRVACSSPSPAIRPSPYYSTDNNIDTALTSPTKKHKSLEQDHINTDDDNNDNNHSDSDNESDGDTDSEDYGSSDLDITEVERLNDNLAKQLVQDRKRKHVEQQSFEEMIKVWHNHCPICLVTKDEEIEHIWTQCPGNDDKVSQVEVYIRGFRINTVFNLEGFAGCFRCLMPLELCQRYDWTTDKHGRPSFRQNTRPCQYDKTVPVAMASIALFGDEKTRCWIRKQAKSWVKTGPITLDEHNTPWWLSRRKRWGLLRHCNNICYTVWAYDQGKMDR